MAQEKGVGTTSLSQYWVSLFRCWIQGVSSIEMLKRSFATGASMNPDSQMYAGESFVFRSQLQTDHQGEAYMLQHVPTIHSVEPTSSGILGGARLTVKGDGFTVDPLAADVVVGGATCQMQHVSLTEIVCILGPANSGFPMQGAAQAGSRGIERQIWHGKGSDLDFEASALPDVSLLGRASMHDRSLSFFEDPSTKTNEHLFPIERFRGFFRPPASGSYTLVSAAHGETAVWVASNADSIESLEKVIFQSDPGSYSPSKRDFSRFTRMMKVQSYGHPAYRVKLEASRRSRKLRFEQGSRYYIEAWYRSTWYLEYFALAAIHHSTNLNEIDKPDAIDEKQLISLETVFEPAKYHIRIRGSGGAKPNGQFKVRFGGKESRSISVDADSNVMASAIRELLSNCEVSTTDIPVERDSAGSPSDCRLGMGWEYRGLKSTTEDGEECLDWDSVETASFSWDAWLVLSAGLDKNLCRNPTWDPAGPLCFYLNSNGQPTAKSCGIPLCGAGADDAEMPADREPFPMVITFELLSEVHGSPPWGMYQGGFVDQDGVEPKVQRGNAFCGSKSLHFSNTFGRLDSNRWGRSNMEGITCDEWYCPQWGWSTDDFPWICMAYR